MTERMGTVYTLTDPRNGLIRYVGATVMTPQARLKAHLYSAEHGDWAGAPLNSRVAVWIRELLTEGLTPTVLTIREAPEDDLLTAEREEIERHYDDGWPLTNHKDSPGAVATFNPARKYSHAKRLVERLTDIGGQLLEDALRDLAKVEADVHHLEAEVAAREAERASLNPACPEGYETAIRLLLKDCNEERRRYVMEHPPLPDGDIDFIAALLLDLMEVADRYGVPFAYIVGGPAQSLVWDMRAGAIQRRPREPETLQVLGLEPHPTPES